MERTREILRQKSVLGRSHREVAASVGVSVGVVGKAASRAARSALSWEAIEALGDKALEATLYGAGAEAGEERPEPDCAWIHIERKKVGVTLELLHLEYLERHPKGLRYTQFCERYRDWLDRRRLSMRQVHHGGAKTFVDFGGKKPCIVDRRTGERIEVEIFVAVLGASNKTFAKAVASQRGPDWIYCHAEMFAFFEGVTKAIVPDQLKSGVTTACVYEPEIQRTYEEMAEHYGTVVFPARPARPKDKAKVEVGVQIVTRWILARLRNETFFSLEELNLRIEELLGNLNNRMMRRYGKTRNQLFDEIDRPALKPLPKERFEYGVWKTASVNIDYHVVADHHLYSVPYRLRWEGRKVDVRIGLGTVEIFFNRERVASHPRSDQRGGFTTNPEHMPKAHREHLEWSPSRIIHWAGTIGAKTAELVRTILESQPHPELGYRTGLGIIRLEKTYGKERVEAACTRALLLGARSYRHVAATLKNDVDRLPLPDLPPQPATPNAGQPAITGPEHEHIRGPDYYN